MINYLFLWKICFNLSNESKWRIQFSWVKAHAGTYGNEVADRPAEGVARNLNMKHAFTKIPKSTLYKEAWTGSDAEMAKRMDNDPQIGSNQAILSQSPEQTEIQNKADPRNDSSADRAWHDEGIPASVSPEGGSDVQLRRSKPINESYSFSLFKHQRSTRNPNKANRNLASK